MPKKNLFHLRLHKLVHPTPHPIYRSRRPVNLRLYVFPKEAPPLLSINTLYKKASKLPQSHLSQKAIKGFVTKLLTKAPKQLKKRRKYFFKAYGVLGPEAQQSLRAWAERFPLTEGAARRQGYLRGQAGLARGEVLLKDFPPLPYIPGEWPVLRILLRSWEMATYWVKPLEFSLPGFTHPLGRNRDYYILHKWLAGKEASIHLQSRASRKYGKYEQKALEVWQDWRLSWA